MTGVGAVIETARVLTKLVNDGTIPRPRRTIRFLWSAEHFGDIMMMHEHPELRGKVLSFCSVDMVGFNQEKAHAVPRLALLPHSLPHFYGDVAEDFFRSVAEANIEQERMPFNSPMADPTFAPTGTRAEMRYTVEQFWGPSDHEDMDEAEIAIPSVEYGHPLHYANPGEDNITGVDPTQMRRTVTILAATAHYMASADAGTVPRLAAFIAGKSQARMASEVRRAIDMMAGASDPQALYRDSLNILTHSYDREIKTVDTLRQLGESPEALAAIAGAKKQLAAVHAADEVTFRETVAQFAASRKLALKEPSPTDAERRLTTFVVKRNEAIRGPEPVPAGIRRDLAGDENEGREFRIEIENCFLGPIYGLRSVELRGRQTQPSGSSGPGQHGIRADRARRHRRILPLPGASRRCVDRDHAGGPMRAALCVCLLAGICRAQNAPDHPTITFEGHPFTPRSILARNMGSPEDQTTAFPPHKVIGNIYYVGTKTLSSFLIVTAAGNILLDSTYERNVRTIQKSVEQLGFKFSDVKILLGNHAHGDHMEGDALVKELTGAKVIVLAEDVPALKAIKPGGKEHPIDQILHDGESVTLGGTTLVAHFTPGHTHGATTWTMKATEGQKILRRGPDTPVLVCPRR